jgi:hypothetical protein
VSARLDAGNAPPGDTARRDVKHNFQRVNKVQPEDFIVREDAIDLWK